MSTVEQANDRRWDLILAHKELWDLWLAVSSLMATQEACPRPGKRVRLVAFKCTAGEARFKHVLSTGGSVIQFSSVTQLCRTPRPHGLQHTRLPCPSPSPGLCLKSSPLSWWCHPTISSSVALFSPCPQPFPESGSFPWVGSSHQVAEVLELQRQHQSFQWIFRVDFL